MAIAHVLLCIAASCIAADAAPDEAAAAKLDFYLSAMLAERQKLRSGEFVISGTKSGKYPTKPEFDFDYSGKVIIYCALDENRIRFDNLEPGIVADLPLTNPPKRRPGRIERMYIRTPQYSATWDHINGRSEIGISRPESISGQFLFFDVRSLGLMAWNQLTDKKGSKVAATIAKVKKVAGAVTIDTSDPKYVQLVLLAGLATGGSQELRYWLRPDQAFAPVKLKLRTRRINSPDEDWQLIERAETSWEQIAGVWVPVELEMSWNREGTEEKLAGKIRWLSVNKEIDDKRFDWEDFGAPDTIPVVDTTTGQAVVIRPGLTVTEWMAQPRPKP